MLNILAQRGVSMIEMVITLVISALLLSLAVPSFKIMLANAQIRTAAQALHDGLQLARVEAIRRNERIRFTKGPSSDWAVTADGSGAALQSKPTNEGAASATVAVIPSAATQVTFNAMGRVTANTDATASVTQMDIDVPTSLISASDSKRRRIVVTSGGSIRICDPNMATGIGAGC